MCEATAGRMRQDGSFGDGRMSTMSLRRVQGGLLLTYVALQWWFPLHDEREWVREVAGVFAGGCFFTMMVIAWTLLMRCGDQRRKEMLQRAALLGVVVTMGLTCIAGYCEMLAGARVHVPLLAVPACLVISTAVAKVVIFRKQWLGLGSEAR